MYKVKERKVATTKYARLQQVPQTNSSSRQKRPTNLINSAARDRQDQLTSSSWNSSIASRNKIICIVIHRVVHSVIIPIKQAQALTFLLWVKQQSSPSHNISALWTILSSKLKWDSANNIHTGAQYFKLNKTYEIETALEHTWTIK